jgi:Xaa-Pro aminopeptidase
MAHYDVGDEKLGKGFCIIDFGIKYEGYHTDITRTLYLGKPSKKEKEIYDMLLDTQKKVIEKIKVGKKCAESYEETLELLGDYSDNFTHGLGHGVGLQIHELPNLKLLSDEVYANNMVFTVEPGVYFENKFGIRIEDSMMIRNNKVEILTKIPKNLIVKER